MAFLLSSARDLTNTGKVIMVEIDVYEGIVRVHQAMGWAILFTGLVYALAQKFKRESDK